MKRRLGLRNLLISSFVLITLTSCQDEEFYEKESYETFTDIYQKENPPVDLTDLTTDDPEEVVDGGNTDVSVGDNSGDTDSNNGGDDNTGDNGGDDNTGDNGGDDNTGDNGGDDNTGDNGGDDNTGDNGGDDQVVVIPKSESFTQTAELTKLDIVWVIDDSGSMADEQAAIAYNFDIFIKDFLQKNVDFKMAITTTDTSSDRAGRAVTGSMQALTSAKASQDEDRFLADFANMVQVGTRGSALEKGLYASSAFANRYGTSFFRDDAYLVIVYVSDEEDQSSGPVASYMDALKAYKAQSSMVKTYTIVDMSNSTTSSGWHSAGYARYEQATQITGGITANIYGNFYNTLTQMGESIARLSESFALNGSPVDGSIEVYVDGVLLNSGWEYDSATRTITFLAGSVPMDGSVIEVKYNQIQ